jgi:Intein splicing domain
MLTTSSEHNVYGAILNPGCRFFDKRIGQSTTLTGRIIAKHMDAYINECITGKYDHVGEAIIYGDTDSVAGDSVIETANGPMDVESLFLSGNFFWMEGDKEYSSNNTISIAHPNSNCSDINFVNYNYVYRHKVSKGRYKITTTDGQSVIVTEDHSVMIMVDGKLIEKKPHEISPGDCVFSIRVIYPVDKTIKVTTVQKVEKLSDFEDEYVYDIGVNDADPYFFANGVLVHNSCYFSAWPIIKGDVEQKRMEWSKDICVQLYDNIADQVNDSFPAFMERACHCPRHMGELIRGGRELVAEKGLYIKKKRYAVLIYDLEGKRLDYDGRPGKVKAMGLDLKRADTPKVVQEFLSDILLKVLTGTGKEEIYDQVREFKLSFANKPAWEKGTPKRVNNLTKYTQEEQKLGRANMPGHVRAAMNWNRLRQMHGDNYSMSIVDGMKTIVCKLKDNPLGLTSVGYPTDETHIPEWFKSLPFDDDLMEITIVDQKVENLLGVLGWNISDHTDIKTTFDSLFTFD